MEATPSRWTDADAPSRTHVTSAIDVGPPKRPVGLPLMPPPLPAAAAAAPSLKRAKAGAAPLRTSPPLSPDVAEHASGVTALPHTLKTKVVVAAAVEAESTVTWSIASVEKRSRERSKLAPPEVIVHGPMYAPPPSSQASSPKVHRPLLPHQKNPSEAQHPWSS